MIVRRLDSVDVRLDSLEVTPDGFWLYDALFARTGCQVYGDCIEYRPPGEVEASFESFELRPLTDLHPPHNLDAKTALVYARGATSSARWSADQKHAQGRLAIWCDKLQAKFDAARKRGKPMQLSAGYTLDLDPTPGVDPNTGERYDAVQRNIRINHVAAVPLGRAGTAQVLDAAETLADSWGLERAKSLADVAPHRSRVHVDMGRWVRHDASDLREPKQQQQDQTMKHTIKIDGADVVLELADNATPEQLIAAVSKAHEDAAAKRKEAHDKAFAEMVAKVRKDTAAKDMANPFGKKPDDEEEEDGKKGKADAKPVDLDKLRADAIAEGMRGADVIGTAKAVMGLRYDSTGKTLDAVRLDVIGRVLGDAERKDAEADPGAIGYLYKRALKAHDERATHGDALVDEIRDARSKSEAARRDGATEPGPITTARRDADETAALPRHMRQKAG